MEETVKDVGEFGLIDRIAKDLIYRPELVVIGSGDDGAVYRVPAGYDQVISTDTMVEGIHFIKKTMRPSDVGRDGSGCDRIRHFGGAPGAAAGILGGITL